MKLSAAAPGLGVLAPRFLLVTHLPVAGVALYLLVLAWAGAPGPVSFDRAWRTAAELGVAEVLLVALGLTLIAFLVQPLQRTCHVVWHGAWPGPLRRGAERRQSARRTRLALAAQVTGDPAALSVPERRAVVAAAQRLSQTFPPPHAVRATRLGNILGALWAEAGRTHGWNAAAAWPYLYPVLPERTRSLVDDARDSLDQSVTTATVTALATAPSVLLLWRSGWWNLLSALLPLVAWLAYTGAVQAARTYAVVVRSAVELHRFELVAALHLPLPADSAEERRQAERLSTLFGQGLWYEAVYAHERAGTGEDRG